MKAEIVREEMNRCGRAGIPFLFGVDFEGIHGFFVEKPLSDPSVYFTIGRKTEPWFACFLVRFLLLNGIAKPDFISYKFKDVSNISLRMIRILYRTPVAVWTLRTPESFLQAKRQYDMVIFEKNF